MIFHTIWLIFSRRPRFLYDKSYNFTSNHHLSRILYDVSHKNVLGISTVYSSYSFASSVDFDST